MFQFCKRHTVRNVMLDLTFKDELAFTAMILLVVLHIHTLISELNRPIVHTSICNYCDKQLLTAKASPYKQQDICCGDSCGTLDGVSAVQAATEPRQKITNPLHAL